MRLMIPKEKTLKFHKDDEENADEDDDGFDDINDDDSYNER